MNSDAHMQMDVVTELTWEPSIDSADIVVSAEDGAVTLGGQVASYFAKSRAVRAAERVYGVRAVADEQIAVHRNPARLEVVDFL